MIVVFVLLFLLIISPLAFGAGLLNIFEKGIQNLGISPQFATGVVVFSVLGSFINLPLTRRISLNVGGALIPLVLSAYLFLHVPLRETLVAVFFMSILCRVLSRYIPGKGVVIPFFVPALFSTGASFVLAPIHIPEVAFISAVLGVLIGADLARIPFIQSRNSKLSIGGSGVFDAIFLVGIISALLGGL
ncbi:MAG: DUF1614 domain-containing protein [Candidatus Wildermuthbacteria bacterium]|nr:DUF1614 domain-containing protein [Candidatus Wildermuthbacteria bacterium]